METLIHRSPGITAIFNAVKKNNRNQILDLGVCTSSNFLFYTRLGCRFHFEDLNELVKPGNSQSDIDKALDVAFCDIKKGMVFDVVLIWDLLNFLSPALVVKLFDKLEPLIHPNTLLFIVPYVGLHRPESPCRFSIQDQYSLHIDIASHSGEKRDRMTSADMLKALPRFFMLRSYVNRQGMAMGFSEQVLSFQPAKNLRDSAFSFAELNDKSVNIDKHILSPSLQQLSTNIGEGKCLLDLGAKNGVNDDAWKRFYGQVYVEDVTELLRRVAGANASLRGDTIRNGKFLSFDDDLRFDAIVAWDLLNYADDDLMFELGRRLVRHCHQGTKLFVMGFSGDRIPPHPQSYFIMEKTLGLSGDNGAMVERHSPKLTSMSIQKYFPGFFIQDTYASRPGMKSGLNEYIFTFKDAAAQARDKRHLIEKVMAAKER